MTKMIRRIMSKNVQYKFEFDEKNRKRIHVWTIIDHDFKSKLFFYFVFSNQNDKMTQVIYIEILKRFNNVTQWLTDDKNFVLKKNRDSAHKIDNVKISLYYWKARVDLKHCFNCSELSNLISIENC